MSRSKGPGASSTHIFGYNAELVLTDRQGRELRLGHFLVWRPVDGEAELNIEGILDAIHEAQMKGAFDVP